MEAPPLGSPRRIEIQTMPVIVGRSKNANARLLHSTVSDQHARIVRRGEAIVLEDLNSTYGTFVNGNRIKKLTLNLNDQVTFGTKLVYRVQASCLAIDESARGIRLKGRDLAVLRENRLLVKDADFEIPADSFVGILGPSGIGKSTLLNCLATFLRPGRGHVEFDDERDLWEHQEEFRSMLGHVPQDDVVVKTLTVTENLRYAARLRFGNKRCSDEIDADLARVLQEVGMKDHKDKQAAKLSGGQRKRLSVAVELLKSPRLLLLDEPTSGLDPATESSLMAQLRHLANRGTTVICTTHLMENVRLFDLVIVFGKRGDCGQIAYVGSPDQLLAHFQCKTYSDLYERLEQGEFEPLRQIDRPLEAAVAQSVSSVLPAIQLVKPATNSSVISAPAIQTLKQLISELGVETSPIKQLATLVERSFQVLVRDRSLLLTMIAQPLVLGGLNCLAQYAASNAVALLFFSVVIAAWLGLNNSARDLVRERRLYIRERLAGLSRGAFLCSKWLFHTMIGAIQIGLLLCVLYFFKHTSEPSLADDLNRTSFLLLFVVLMAVYTGALGLGLLISELVQTEEAAIALLPLLIMPQLLISAVGTGQLQEVFHYSNKHVPFGPLVIAVKKLHALEPSARLAELASFACYSRPAVLLIKPPKVVESRRFDLIADGIHLALLIIITWTMTIMGFQWAEERWGRLIGIG